MKIKTMIVTFGISSIILGNCVFSSEGYLGLQATKGADGALVIKQVINGSVASFAGLKPKDRILKINDVNVNGLSYEKSKNLLKGEAGKSVKILVSQNGNLREMRLVRSSNKNGIINVHKKSQNPKISKSTFKAKVKKNDIETTQKQGYGFYLIKEPYNGKIIVVDIIKNSPADKAGITIGNEIIKVNNKKAKKVSLQDILSYKRGNLNLYIRNNNNDKISVTLHAENILISDTSKDNADYQLLNTYWLQLTPTNWEMINPIHPAVYKRLSRQGKNDANTLRYWYDRKIKFYNGYISCTMNSENYEFIHSCLSDLVSSTKAEIQHEQDLAHERAMMAAQQQISTLNALSIFTHAHALMNQNVNVRHSGTINHNVNMYGNFNVQHRGWIFHY